MILTIEIPWPDKCLSPNGGKRTHHMKLHRLGNRAAETAWALTLKALAGRSWSGPALLHIHGFYSNEGGAASADDDNLVAWMKRPRDGVAKALGINDRDIRTGQVTFGVNRAYPRVVLTIEQPNTKDGE